MSATPPDHPRLRLLVFLLAVISAGVEPALADDTPGPSFDCNKARAPIELVICTDLALGTLDGALGKAYFERREALSGEARETLLADQREWLGKRTASCPVPKDPETDIVGRWKAEPCLVKLYEARIRALGGQVPILAEGAPAAMVPPLCFDALQLFGMVETAAGAGSVIDLSLCRAALAHVPVEPGAPGYFFQRRADFRFPAGTMGYHSIATLSDGRWILELVDNGGGTGWFSSLLLMQRRGEDLVLERSIFFGDRCNGGLDSAEHLDGTRIRAEVNITSTGLIALPDAGAKDDQIPGIDDLSDAAVSCIGKARYDIDLGSGAETFVGVTVDQLPDAETTASYHLQPCFNRLVERQLGTLPGFLTAQDVSALVRDFLQKCNGS